MECILENIRRWLVFNRKAQLSRGMRQFERRKAVETGVCRVFSSASARHVNVASAPSMLRLLQRSFGQRSFGPKRSFSSQSSRGQSLTHSSQCACLLIEYGVFMNGEGLALWHRLTKSTTVAKTCETLKDSRLFPAGYARVQVSSLATCWRYDKRQCMLSSVEAVPRMISGLFPHRLRHRHITLRPGRDWTDCWSVVAGVSEWDRARRA